MQATTVTRAQYRVFDPELVNKIMIYAGPVALLPLVLALAAGTAVWRWRNEGPEDALLAAQVAGKADADSAIAAATDGHSSPPIRSHPSAMVANRAEVSTMLPSRQCGRPS